MESGLRTCTSSALFELLKGYCYGAQGDLAHQGPCAPAAAAALGEIPYANLRYRNGPDNRLPWKCRGQTDDEAFLKFDCNWVGNWLRPGSMQPRKEKDITPMNKDEWIDSLEVNEVSDRSNTMQGLPVLSRGIATQK